MTNMCLRLSPKPAGPVGTLRVHGNKVFIKKSKKCKIKGAMNLNNRGFSAVGFEPFDPRFCLDPFLGPQASVFNPQAVKTPKFGL